MSKVSIVYWTQGGNTQAMAEAIGEGVTAAGVEADVPRGRKLFSSLFILSYPLVSAGVK